MFHQTYRYTSVIIFHLFLASSLNMLNADGATHIVGDSNGWNLFRDSTNWTQGKEFHVGDVLVFNYERGFHNVMQVNSTAYTNCIKDPYLSLFTSGNDSLVLSEIGERWYICGMSDHCENGQKFSIIVVPQRLS